MQQQHFQSNFKPSWPWTAKPTPAYMELNIGKPWHLGLPMPLATETGAGEEFLKSARSSAGMSAENEGSAGRSAGSSAGTSAIQVTALLPALLPAFPSFPALIPALLPALLPALPSFLALVRSTFQNFLSGTRFCGQRLRKSWCQSPIASVQRTLPTLARHSAVPRGTNVKRIARFESQHNERRVCED